MESSGARDVAAGTRSGRSELGCFQSVREGAKPCTERSQAGKWQNSVRYPARLGGGWGRR